MTKIIVFAFAFAILLLSSCQEQPDKVTNKMKETALSATSPDGKLEMVFYYQDEIGYYVLYKGRTVIDSSALGMAFKNAPDLAGNFEAIEITEINMDHTWEQPWGEQKNIHNYYNEVSVTLQEKTDPHRKFQIEYKVFNDGVAFRYVFPEQAGTDSIFITKELTEFNFLGDYTGYTIPAYTPDKYEHLYSKKAISAIDTVHTPLTIVANDSLYLSIHEAALFNFASMTLFGDSSTGLKVDLVPWQDGIKVKAKKTFTSSWRTILIADKATALLDSRMILNLNEPNKLGDVSWVKPIKYIGIWWGMHIGDYTFNEGERHGATTERAKKYIDFAAKHGFDEVLIEGWNKGFTSKWWASYGKDMDFTKPTDDFAWTEVVQYAKDKGVLVQAYNETCANSERYFSQIDTAYSLYEKMGYKSIKVGQVAGKFLNGEWHHGQYGVNYYQTVVDKAAQHKLGVNFHEPIKATGTRRTYPNMLSREGARGQEYNAWSNDGGNPANHTCILPFTRMLAGPMDFTPGIFELELKGRPKNRVQTTLAKQLASVCSFVQPRANGGRPDRKL